MLVYKENLAPVATKPSENGNFGACTCIRKIPKAGSMVKKIGSVRFCKRFLNAEGEYLGLEALFIMNFRLQTVTAMSDDMFSDRLFKSLERKTRCSD